ncbi:hypothetical protein CLV30_12631 [Haloactinopolyspora alba]|uniref:DUF4386 family protein n=1 Tax=Haloactinopolyspora alba TaxID=648780 RepID=A0A2P8DGN1_9ACTN|nr:hypothetical protein [Haloactinopolyspora alba]PSK96372.1 hypothetical protein CLV30_12631 [Haloactinopolyspora alba]
MSSPATTQSDMPPGAPGDRSARTLAGALFAALFVGGLITTSILVPASAPPNRPDSAATDIQRYFLENGGVAELQALTQTTAAFLLVLFIGSLAAMVRRLESERSGLAETVTSGGIVAAAFLAVSALLAGTLGAEQISDSPATVSALRQLSFFIGGVGHTVGLGVLVGAVSLAAHRARALPRWLTVAGLVSATLSMLSLLSIVVFAANLFIPLGRFSGLLVIAATSLLMFTGRVGREPAKTSVTASIAGGVGVVVLAMAMTILV